ncbi:MAG: queuine tRNA-ribosyltransferase family protein [Ignavibacteria bacterium]|nr:queuine tRNA-ribosyltransferase family protein [Ignavibacteria bacterium]
MKSLKTRSGEMHFPVFLPDGTRGIVRSVDSSDLEACGIEAIVVNTLHLTTKPGLTTVNGIGGIHEFMNFHHSVISDSGGFQVYSLITESKAGTIHKDGFTYKLEQEKEKQTLTPEKCIQHQFRIGADIIYCLDYCTHPSAPDETQIESVELTIKWAKRCKKEYENQIKIRKISDEERPLIFGVVQGGNSKELRKKCVDALMEIGFDGYGFGGWPIDDEGKLLEMVGFVAELVGAGYPKHALGIGKPENLVRAFIAGYEIFDCVIPTRDARHKRLYTFKNYDSIENIDDLADGFYKYLYMQDDIHIKDFRPIEEGCDCHTCRHFTRSYLHHLFRIGDTLANRLATIHNLRFYTRLTDKLRQING